MPSSLLDPTATPVSPTPRCIATVDILTSTLATDAPSPAIGSSARSLRRSTLRVVLLCVSPIAPTRRVVAAVAASVAAGNRTLVSFPAGATRRTRTAVRLLSDRLGRDRLVVVTGAELATDPDAELAHLVSVDGSSVAAAGGTSVPHAGGSAAQSALASLFSDPFPVDEWTARAGSRR